MRYYPLFLDLTGRKCVVVGSGNVAERKVARLLACGARVEVVGERLTPVLEAWLREGKMVHHAAEYRDSFLQGASLVIGAARDGAVNGRVAEDARALKIPVNIVDDPVRCDFILPSVVERGDLCIAVSTGGRSPALAKRIGKEIATLYGPEYAVLLSILGELRKKVLARGRPSAENRACFEAVLCAESLDHVRAGRWRELEEVIRRLTGIEMEVEPR